jgi:hypothetical protein
MNTESRPNIVTVGALAGAVSWFVCFGIKTWGGLDLGAEGGIAMSTLLTYAVQYADRISKRGSSHVIQKYGR